MSNNQTPAIVLSSSSNSSSVNGFQRSSTGVRHVDASADLAFFQMFQQLGKQPGLSAGQPSPLFPPTQPEVAQPSLLVDTADDDDTPVQETLKATVTKVVAQHGDDLPPLKLDKPLSKQDGDFLEWLVNQQTPVNVQLNGLPVNLQLPAWLAGQAMSQGGGGGSRGVTGQLSEQMATLVKEASRTGRAIRVPLQNSVEVILKIRHGQVSAEFLTPDASPSLQQTVAELRQHLASKALPVGTIGVRQRTAEDNPNQRHDNQPDDDDKND